MSRKASTTRPMNRARSLVPGFMPHVFTILFERPARALTSTSLVSPHAIGTSFNHACSSEAEPPLRVR
jgi:hypothetical protein